MYSSLEILLVEDEIINAILIRKQLETNGFLVKKHVVSGEEAISSTKESNYDVVLMDIRLAGTLDGIEAAANILETNKIHIIFITGYDDVKMQGRALALQPVGYLKKPVNVGELISLLKQLLR
jgi:CheY-like chemotaxis protein